MPAVLLAAPAVDAGGLGALVILALIVAGVLLFRSLNHQLKKVPPEFPPPPGFTPPGQRDDEPR